jgi:hypothetical protein
MFPPWPATMHVHNSLGRRLSTVGPNYTYRMKGTYELRTIPQFMPALRPMMHFKTRTRIESRPRGLPGCIKDKPTVSNWWLACLLGPSERVPGPDGDEKDGGEGH